ncbi:hypothetical protein FHS89_000487 [Rubricella aquisinus]|uniref:Uncharacterized protein n=1 Tax=Rubricella aquisinus TaxID=2028108 RepID=A0A840WH96_9RHOB|nr:hypothetical protein [Rubricella aquisinus]MBB5514489.1 hypothetical protein [Rubricella aquisinus]
MASPFDPKSASLTVIDGPSPFARRAHMEALLDGLSLTADFTDGATGAHHAEACARAHLGALGGPLPQIVLENDLALTGDGIALPPLPKDADIIYLGVSPFGALSPSPAHLEQVGRRVIHGLTLASVQDADWLRVHSMSGAIAILYVSERGRARWADAAREAIETGLAFDTCCAYAMRDVVVYAPHLPVFYEARHLQRRLKRVTPAQREAWTRRPIRPVVEGDIRVGNLGWGRIMAQAVPGGSGLEWKLLSGPS